MTIVSGIDPDIADLCVGQPVVDFLGVDLDELAPFRAANGLSLRLCLLFSMDFQEATVRAGLVARAMKLTMKRLLKATGLIIPHAGLPKIDKGAILTTTTIVRFTRVPMGACSDGGSVGPGPLALVTFVSGSNPRQFSIFREIIVDFRIVVLNEEPSDLDAGCGGVGKGHWFGVELEESPADADPALSVCSRRQQDRQGQGQAQGKR